MWQTTRGALNGLSLVAVAALLSVPLLTTTLGPSIGPTANVPTGPFRTLGSAWLSVGGYVGSDSHAGFYGINFEAYGLGPNDELSLGAFFNSTPVSFFRLYGGGEAYDPTTQTEYTPAPTGINYTAVPGQYINYTWFKIWCSSRSTPCQWLADLPAEENDTAAAVHYAKWFHSVLGYAPTYWELGNEPEGWMHYGKNYTKWTTADNSTPTGSAYATMVHNYISAITRLYPSDRFIGIEASCSCNPSYISTIAAVDGTSVASMAYHDYPWATASTSNVTQFFGALRSPRNLTNATANFRSMITSGCSTCGAMPIEVGEYQAGPVPTFSPYASSYSGAPFIAASAIQAIDANVSQFTVFDLGMMYNSSSGAVHPQGVLYDTILANMTRGSAYSVRVHAPSVGGVYALLVKNGTHESLLLVNTNTTKTLALSISTTFFPVGALGSFWTWSSTSASPSIHRLVTLPNSYSIPPQGILLLNNY